MFSKIIFFKCLDFLLNSNLHHHNWIKVLYIKDASDADPYELLYGSSSLPLSVVSAHCQLCHFKLFLLNFHQFTSQSSCFIFMLICFLAVRFGEVKMDYRSPAGFDRTRNAVIGHKDFDLTYLGRQWSNILVFFQGCGSRSTWIRIQF